jgi:hypothetical protein
MELSVLTLRVVLLFFPGVLCALIVHALTIQRERTTPQFLTSAFVYGVSTYLLLASFREAYAAGASLVGWNAPPRVTFFDVLTNERARIAWGEIAFSAVVAVLLAVLLSAAVNHNLLHRAAERLRVSRRFGQADVWGHFLDSPKTNWIIVRDVNADLLFEGWVDAFSDTGADPQLLLSDVVVYRASTGTKLHDRKRVYLTPRKESVILEEA